MIAIRLEGRLGNQLFQYAFIVTASKKLQTQFYIDQYSYRCSIDNYFENITGVSKIGFSKLFKINGYKNVFSFHLRRAYYKYLEKFLKLSAESYDFDLTPDKVVFKNNTIYQGYFQSTLFFHPVEELIRKQFVLKKKFIDKFNLKYGELYRTQKIVTVHIRRTDYQNLPHLNLGGGDLSLPVAYYKKAIAGYQQQDVCFMFISDDVDFVTDNFKDVPNKVISADSEIMDFQHLLNADDCIISNSTFSWWGAWLNNKPGKVVHAPRYFMGWRVKKETPFRIYPASWNQIDF